MSPHPTVIEAGPGGIRRLCCGTAEPAPHSAAALDCIDDPVALIDGQPVSVPELWADLLRSLVCGPDPDSVLIIHSTWWSTARVDLIVTAAGQLSNHVATQPRSQLLTAGLVGNRVRVVVEIAARLVAITVSGTVAEPRIGPPGEVVEAVVRRVAAMTRGAAAIVLIDRPDGVGGAAALAVMIAERLRAVLVDAMVELVDDTRLAGLAAPPRDPPSPGSATETGRRPSRNWALLAAGAVLSAAALAINPGAGQRHLPPPAEAPATTFLVEGRVAVQVPAQWPVRRVRTGPGSARVEVFAPADPELVLHLTQSAVPGESLPAAAESLQHALEKANAAEAAGVFVDFTPSAVSAGRAAVTYREQRHDHHIAWTVLVDAGVRVAIGCQSAPGDAETMRPVCEQAVRSARVLH